MSKKAIRTRHGYPVRDAKENLQLMLLVEDIKSGTKKDRTCCALANACFRTFAAEFVEICQSRAYVTLPDEKTGEIWLERYTLDPKAAEIVKRFDAGKPVKAGRVLLAAPRPSEQLQSLSKKGRSEKAKIRKLLGLTGKTQKPRRPKKIFARNSSGKIKFKVGQATGKNASE
jgi:hypothetical protein